MRTRPFKRRDVVVVDLLSATPEYLYSLAGEVFEVIDDSLPSQMVLLKTNNHAHTRGQSGGLFWSTVINRSRLTKVATI